MKVTSEDWYAIIHVMAGEMDSHIRRGVLKPPLRILITGGNDEPFGEFELRLDPSGKVLCEALSDADRDRSAAIPFPVTYAVTDRNGKEAEANFSEEIVRELRRVS